MAIDDIRVKLNFYGHHKTKKLVRLLGNDAVVALQKLWIYAAEARPRGILYGMDESDIAISAEWDGDESVFVNTLKDVGFIDVTVDNYVDNFELHDWKDHQPYIYHAPERSERARVASAKRWGIRGKCGLDAGSIEVAMPSVQSSNPPSPTPTPSPAPNPSPNPEETPVFSKPSEEEWLQNLSPMQRDFVEWESGEFEMTVLPKMASFYGHLPQCQELPGWRGGVPFVRDYEQELRGKVMSNPDYFKDHKPWKDELARFIKVGLESGRQGNAGMKPISATKEREDEKRLRTSSREFKNGSGVEI